MLHKLFRLATMVSAALLFGSASFAQAPDTVSFHGDTGVEYSFDEESALAAQGDLTAQFRMGVMYDSGRGVTQNSTEAVYWYKLAAEKGLREAQYNLALMYDNGDGVPEDNTEAAKWYKLAARQGLAEAQYNLGGAYFNGEGVPQNFEKALRLYQLAAEQGKPEAQYNVGMMYYFGKGASQNTSTSKKWLEAAAEQGVAQANQLLEQIRSEEAVTSPNEVRFSTPVDNGAAENFSLYSNRQKTLLEEVLNYSTTGNENGLEDFYWVQSETDQCTLKRQGGPSPLWALEALSSGFSLNIPPTINIRSFNQTAFAIDASPKLAPGSSSLTYSYIYGEPNYSIRLIFADVGFDGSRKPDVSRLHKAWSLAFQECPGKKSRF
ncbi:MAG: tetratricopeptide repeat protein [Hyphomonas sp.]